METVDEQMERFYAAVEKLWPEMKRQMRDNADKGGWQDAWPGLMLAKAYTNLGRAMSANANEEDKEIIRQHSIAAVNYLVMAYERLSAEETE